MSQYCTRAVDQTQSCLEIIFLHPSLEESSFNSLRESNTHVNRLFTYHGMD